MNIHKNARLTVESELQGRSRAGSRRRRLPKPQASARGLFENGLSATGVKDGRLAGPSSRPHRLRRPTPETVVAEIERLRRQRWTGKQIAAETGVSPATVSRVLHRLGLNKLSALEPEPVRRYEREHPGELIHLDIKKLGRIGSVGHRITGRYPGAVNRHLGIGWEFVHVCIDDASRVAFVQVMPDQRKASAVAFLEAAIAYYTSLGIRVQRVMTDNGSCYRSKTFRAACIRLGLRQIFTKPYTPRTNGKAERFIQTSLREGPMPAPTTLPTNALPSCHYGFTATTGIGLMAVSAQNHPSADSA
jgi:transposase InsO family protein